MVQLLFQLGRASLRMGIVGVCNHSPHEGSRPSFQLFSQIINVQERYLSSRKKICPKFHSKTLERMPINVQHRQCLKNRHTQLLNLVLADEQMYAFLHILRIGWCSFENVIQFIVGVSNLQLKRMRHSLRLQHFISFR